jgi:hypothetical protein
MLQNLFLCNYTSIGVTSVKMGRIYADSGVDYAKKVI